MVPIIFKTCFPRNILNLSFPIFSFWSFNIAATLLFKYEIVDFYFWLSYHIKIIFENIQHYNNCKKYHKLFRWPTKTLNCIHWPPIDRLVPTAEQPPILWSLPFIPIVCLPIDANQTQVRPQLICSSLLPSLWFRCRNTSCSLDGTSDASKPTRSALMTRKHPSPRHYTITTSGIGLV